MGTSTYDKAAATIRTSPSVPVRDDRELIRLASLAASSHNTQPWVFERSDGSILIRPDRSRRCPVVDPEDAHLYRSLGCAAENLVHAASQQQLRTTVRFDESTDAVVIDLEPAPEVEPTELSAALATRQCTRTAYDGRPAPGEQLTRLRAAGSSESVECLIRTSPADIEPIAELIDAGNRRQLGDEAWRSELLEWLRFNPAEALRRRDGLAGRVNAQPSLPTVLGRLLAPLVFRAESQVRTDRARLESSAGIAAFVASEDSRASWVEAGRCYERFALQADLFGIRTAFINQPVEVADLRPLLERLLGTGGSAQLLIRFGYAGYAPYSLRRPVDEVFAAP
ncbi:MAG TPA: Tat pathway signal protein [Actinomycetes bacterium]|nr:Tat pathway signal protein [Actinomycetes bacterium]